VASSAADEVSFIRAAVPPLNFKRGISDFSSTVLPNKPTFQGRTKAAQHHFPPLWACVLTVWRKKFAFYANTRRLLGYHAEIFGVV
jgi:hypothetical protein